MKKMNSYKFHSGIKMRAYPSNKQRHIVFLNSRAKDYVYNKCKAIDDELFYLRKVKIYSQPIAERIEFLKSLRGDYKQIANMAPFLNGKDIDSMAGANAIADYNKAWDNYKKVPGTGIPTFHKRTNIYSYQTSPHYQNGKITGSYFVDESHIVLPKVGRVRVKGDAEYIHRMLTNTERFGTFTVTIEPDGRCFISVQLASDTAFKEKYEKNDSAVGIDVNVKNTYSDSDGNVINNPKYLSKAEEKLAKEQRKLSKKLESAKSDCPDDMKLRDFLLTRMKYQAQRKKVAHIHSHVANQREDFLNCCTKELVKNHGIIISEDLKVKNLLKNHCLAKSISDVSWDKLFIKLKHECDARGRKYIKVSPQLTSQTCHECGSILPIKERLTLSDREWTCPNCGTHLDRDINSAKNIKDRGLATL